MANCPRCTSTPGNASRPECTTRAPKAAADPIGFTLGEKQYQRKYVEHAGNEEPVEVISTTTATVTTLQTTVSAQASEMLDASTSLDMPEGSICTMEDGCIMCGS
ncbi:MAG: hypothetical protein U0T81_14520 [Saprospiraceae bacterium]